MAEVWTMGEMIVEIMRSGIEVGLNEAGIFIGPYPSGAPAILIDTVARLGHIKPTEVLMKVKIATH